MTILPCEQWLTQNYEHYRDETMISNYVKNQGGSYRKLHNDHQLVLF